MTKKEQQTDEILQEIAQDIKAKLPDGMGFALLTYEFGEKDNKRLLYISDSNRLDVIKAMAEFIEKNIDNPEIFGKDI